MPVCWIHTHTYRQVNRDLNKKKIRDISLNNNFLRIKTFVHLW
jgi:hypothetical protein